MKKSFKKVLRSVASKLQPISVSSLNGGHERLHDQLAPRHQQHSRLLRIRRWRQTGNDSRWDEYLFPQFLMYLQLKLMRMPRHYAMSRQLSSWPVVAWGPSIAFATSGRATERKSCATWAGWIRNRWRARWSSLTAISPSLKGIIYRSLRSSPRPLSETKSSRRCVLCLMNILREVNLLINKNLLIQLYL